MEPVSQTQEYNIPTTTDKGLNLDIKSEKLDIIDMKEECPVCLDSKLVGKHFKCSSKPHLVCDECADRCKCCPMCRADRIKPIQRCIIWNSRVFYNFIQRYTNNPQIAEQKFQQHLTPDCYIHNHSIKISQENNIYYMECLQCKIRTEFKME
jgi:hypothetical protein